MSSKIRVLPDELITRIAAGEVVERPASVVKELLENSLDAGATEIYVTVEGAGRRMLAISDNGCGMTKDDAHLALKRHATSKISEFEDLEKLSTFGFRGEALPSIASVSHFRLTTRASDTDSGWDIDLKGGRLVHEAPVARERGTTIEVRDLFFNTPARHKFMKADATERGQIVRVLEEVAFSSPDARFHYQIEEARPLVIPTGQTETTDERIKTLRERAQLLWGPRFSRGLEAVEAAKPHVSMWGVVSNQGFHQASTKHQILFINRRPVTNRRLTRAIYDAYVGQLPQGRNPAWILFLDIDPQAVDVNVHPAKREVKIAFESELFEFVLSAVKTALRKAAPVPSETTPLRFLSEPPAAYIGSAPSTHPGGASPLLTNIFKEHQNVATAPLATTGQTEFRGFKDQTLFAAAQIKNTYVLAHAPDGLLIVDQHAAAEKVIYEKLQRNMHAAKPSVQMLLVPFTWEVPMVVDSLIKEKIGLFSQMGFIVEPFGSGTLVVKGYPSVLGEKFDLPSLLDAVAEEISESDDARGGHERNFEHRLSALTACKAAVKAGDALDIKSCQYLLNELLLCDDPLTCPHGRPTVIRFTFSELERRFRRT